MIKPVRRYYQPIEKVKKANPQNLEDMKNLYKLSFKKDYEFDHVEDFFMLHIFRSKVWETLTKEQKEEYKKWKSLEDKIRNKDFPELSQ